MRSSSKRRRHVEHLLASKRDCWLASASDDRAHLIPVSYWWDGSRLLIGTFRDSVTTRNLTRSGRARVALPSTEDVVLIDATVTMADPTELSEADAIAFADKAGFDVRNTEAPFVILYLKPTRILAWQDEAELAGREIMREGRWIET